MQKHETPKTGRHSSACSEATARLYLAAPMLRLIRVVRDYRSHVDRAVLEEKPLRSTPQTSRPYLLIFRLGALNSLSEPEIY
jgi:hypothetical protein